MALIELGQPLPDLRVRVALGAANSYELSLSTVDGTPLSLTDTSVLLELGATVLTATLSGNIATFSIPTASALRALVDVPARLVLVNSSERTIVASGRSVAA